MPYWGQAVGGHRLERGKNIPSLCNSPFGPVCDRQHRDSIPICWMRKLKLLEGKGVTQPSSSPHQPPRDLQRSLDRFPGEGVSAFGSLNLCSRHLAPCPHALSAATLPGGSPCWSFSCRPDMLGVNSPLLGSSPQPKLGIHTSVAPSLRWVNAKTAHMYRILATRATA